MAPVPVLRKVDSMNDMHKHPTGLAFYLQPAGMRHTLTPHQLGEQRQLASDFIKTCLSSDGRQDRARCLSYASQALQTNELDVTYVDTLDSVISQQQIGKWRQAMREKLGSHSVIMQIQERDGRVRIHYHAVATLGDQIKSFLCYEDNLESTNPLLHLLVYPTLQAIRADARLLLAYTAGGKLHDDVADQQVKDQTVTATRADHHLWKQLIKSSTILCENGLLYREDARIIDLRYFEGEVESNLRKQIAKLTPELAQPFRSQGTHPSRSGRPISGSSIQRSKSRSLSPRTAPGLPSAPPTGHRSSIRPPQK